MRALKSKFKSNSFERLRPKRPWCNWIEHLLVVCVHPGSELPNVFGHKVVGKIKWMLLKKEEIESMKP